MTLILAFTFKPQEIETSYLVYTIYYTNRTLSSDTRVILKVAISDLVAAESISVSILL